jgi:ribonuclease VapC
MVVDTSAIVAILFDEPERDRLAEVLVAEPILALSAMTFYETSLVTAGKKKDRRAVRIVDEMIATFSMEIIACDIEQTMAARDAYLKYGRGWNVAGLNLADCFSYALAKLRSEPLLFKGNDFLRTDIVPALRR